MKKQLSVMELTSLLQFQTKGKCHCDGFETWIFKHNEGWILKWRKYKAQFGLFKNREKIHGWDTIINLQKTLEKECGHLIQKS